MKKDRQSTGHMNQSLEITNVKGDTGESLENGNKNTQIENRECYHDLFYRELRVIVEDSAREDSN